MGSTGGSGRVRLAAAERQRQILDVATEHFRNSPQADVSLDAIADEVGVTRALINHHFGTKRDLYVAVVRHVLALNPVEVPAYVHGVTGEDRLRETVDNWFAHTARASDLWIASMRSGGMGDAEIFEIVEQARDAYVVQFVAVLGLGPIVGLTPAQWALLRGWEGLAEAVAVEHFEHSRLNRHEAIELIVDAGTYCAGRVLAERADEDVA